MKKLQTDRALDLEHAFVERLRRRSVRPRRFVRALRAAAALVLRGWLRIYHRFEVVGHEQLRTNRSLVIVANHCSHLDTLCLVAALPVSKLHQAFPVAASDYFFQSVPRTWMAAMINALPFGRNAHVRRGLSICSEVIRQPGNILIVFPEGTRSMTGKTTEFKLGVAAMVGGSDAAVVPCRLEGTHKAWPKGRRFPRPNKIRLIVGAPRSYCSRGTDKTDLFWIASDLRNAVEQLASA